MPVFLYVCPWNWILFLSTGHEKLLSELLSLFCQHKAQWLLPMRHNIWLLCYLISIANCEKLARGQFAIESFIVLLASSFSASSASPLVKLPLRSRAFHTAHFIFASHPFQITHKLPVLFVAKLGPSILLSQFTSYLEESQQKTMEAAMAWRSSFTHSRSSSDAVSNRIRMRWPYKMLMSIHNAVNNIKQKRHVSWIF